MTLDKTKGENLLGFHGKKRGLMGWCNPAELIGSESPFSVPRLWASRAQPLCGKDVCSV